MKKSPGKPAFNLVFYSGFLILLLLASSCKKRCWQCVRPESGEPIFAELCNDAPDYNRQTLENYKYACTIVEGVVKELP